MSGNEDSTQRLFFALWPSPALQQRAREAAQARVRRGRLLPAINLHITLAFLGELDAGQKRRVQTLADDLQQPPFTLVLDRFGCWRRRGIAWLAPSQWPQALTDLHAGLINRLEAAGFAMERRRFFPHLTVARRAKGPAEEEIEALEWPVTEFRLIRSSLGREGACYTTEVAWPLAGKG